MLSFWLFWLAIALPTARAFVRSSPSLTGQDPGTLLLPSTFRGAAPKERANIVYDDLTILLPAYNEADRIIETLQEYSSYISKDERDVLGSLLSIDILVVDDGSADDTAGVVRRYTECNPNIGLSIDCISLPSNEGKGGAIASGMEKIVGRQQRTLDDSKSNISADGISLVLVADADGSGDLSCLGDMLDALNNLLVNQKTQKVYMYKDDNAALVVGDRGYDGAGIARIVLRWGFRTAVSIICGNLGVSDTQCGMKLMTLDAAKTLYRDLNLRRWSHDVEVLYRAKMLGVPVDEVPINWEDKDGSKLVTSAGGAIGASLRMLLETMQMRVAYGLGRWRVHEPVENDE